MLDGTFQQVLTRSVISLIKSVSVYSEIIEKCVCGNNLEAKLYCTLFAIAQLLLYIILFFNLLIHFYLKATIEIYCWNICSEGVSTCSMYLTKASVAKKNCSRKIAICSANKYTFLENFDFFDKQINLPEKISSCSVNT